MRIDEEITHGIFCCEIKNRFRASVSINGTETICYVASSCRLSNFLRLEDKKVLLLHTGKNASSTEYTLFAVRHRNSYILLELSMANAAISEQIYRRYFSFLKSRKQIHRERIIAGYKTDIYIEDTNTIVEIKTVIAEQQTAIFPTVHSDRSLDQLEKIEKLLNDGNRVCYLFASLCPSVKCIEIDKVTEFYKRFVKCIEKGLIYKACKLKTTESKIEVDGLITIKV